MFSADPVKAREKMLALTEEEIRAVRKALSDLHTLHVILLNAKPMTMDDQLLKLLGDDKTPEGWDLKELSILSNRSQGANP